MSDAPASAHEPAGTSRARPGNDPETGSAARPLRLAAVIPSLRAGGAERVLAGLAGDLAARGHGVRIVTLERPGERPFYPLADGVGLAPLGLMAPGAATAGVRILVRAVPRLRALLAADRPDAVLGFTTLGSVMALLAAHRLRLPVIAAERIDPAAHGVSIGRLKAAARDRLYRGATHVVVQTGRARRALGFLPDERISVIANPVERAALQARVETAGPDGRLRLIAVGRLERQKGLDLLIPAFAHLAPRFAKWDLIVFGAGSEHAALAALIERARLSGRVRLAGLTAAIGQEYALSHAFAFPSRFEGFPNALAEAMAAGLPAVAFAAVAGVEELIVDGRTGLLADLGDPVASLVRQLATLMADADLRARIGAAAQAQVAAYDPGVLYRRWEELLRRIVDRNR